MRAAIPLDGSVLGALPPERPQVPVWLLDVDGVLNAVTPAPDPTVWPRAAWLDTSATADGARFPICAARPVLDFLSEVHVAGAAEIRWHTTWQHDAVTTLAPALGLPELPVQPAPEFHAPAAVGYGGLARGPAWWKLPAAERVVGEERRALLWTDDDLMFERGTAGLGAVDRCADRLLISPQTSLGLTPRHLREIRAWLGL